MSHSKQKQGCGWMLPLPGCSNSNHISGFSLPFPACLPFPVLMFFSCQTSLEEGSHLLWITSLLEADATTHAWNRVNTNDGSKRIEVAGRSRVILKKWTRLTRMKRQEEDEGHGCLQTKQTSTFSKKVKMQRMKNESERPQLLEKRWGNLKEHGGGERSPPWWCHMITSRQDEDAEIKGRPHAMHQRGQTSMKSTGQKNGNKCVTNKNTPAGRHAVQTPESQVDRTVSVKSPAEWRLEKHRQS